MAEAPAATETVEFRLPSLGSDMDAGTIIGWRVAVGDTVHKGDVLLDVDTEKAEIEVEVWHDAVVVELLVAAGTEVPVGTPLAVLGPVGTAIDKPTEPSQPTEESRAVPAPPEPFVARGPAIVDVSPVRDAVGVAQSAAAESSVVTPRTVYWRREMGAAPVAPEPAPAVAVETGSSTAEDRAGRMRGVIAALMSRSNDEIPHYHLTTEVDLHEVTDWLDATNLRLPVTERVLPAAVLLRAVAVAAAANPALNGTMTDQGFEPASGVHLGVAIHLRAGGLVAPAILDADTLDVHELMARLRDLVGRARAGKLRSSEMTAASLTITNLGDQGVDSVLGVIHPPQVALVGIGRISDRPFAVDGAVVARPGVTITLSADHRATDGHVGARFLQTVADVLRDPASLQPTDDGANR